MNSGVVQATLAAQVAAAIISDEEDQGIVGKPLLVKTTQYFANSRVHFLDGIQIYRPIFAAYRIIREIRGELDSLRVHGVFRFFTHGLPALLRLPVSDGKSDLREKWLALLAGFPALSVEERFRLKVEVRLGAVAATQRGVIPMFPVRSVAYVPGCSWESRHQEQCDD